MVLLVHIHTDSKMVDAFGSSTRTQHQILTQTHREITVYSFTLTGTQTHQIWHIYTHLSVVTHNL